MSIKVEDTKRASEIKVTDTRTGEIVKIVYLQDIQVGPTSDPKGLDVTGDATFRQSLQVSGTLIVSGPTILTGGLSGSLQRTPGGLSYLTGRGPLFVTSASNGQIFVNTEYESSPNAVDGLAMWFEASADNVVLDATAPTSVSRWTDLSGNGRHLGQGTKARQPRWFAANPQLSGSAPSLEFQGAQILTSSNVSLTTFTVIIALTNKSNGTIIFEHGADLNSTDGAWLFTSRSTTSGGPLHVKRSGTSCIKDLSTATWATNSDLPMILTMLHGGTTGSLRLYIDNVDMREMSTPVANNLGSAATNAVLNVGARSTPTLQMSGSMMALAVYTPAITPFQAAKVARYFGRRYGIHVL